MRMINFAARSYARVSTNEFELTGYETSQQEKSRNHPAPEPLDEETGIHSNRIESPTPRVSFIDDAKRLGVSVYYLQSTFLREVSEAGLSKESTIYQLEDLRGSPGLIRRKGEHITCPITGQRGAAYVHCLHGADNVGPANYMLSYTWGYTVGDIVEALVDFCANQVDQEGNSLDPKKTYVWICCLCINQQVVVAKNKSGMLNDTPVDFFEEFGDRVKGIRHILALMSPWHSPSYLQRVWCIFEIYTASFNGCQITIIMPPAEKRALQEALVGDSGSIDSLYQVLARTKVEAAQASVESDRTAILDMVKNNPGYRTLNNSVNGLLRAWVRRSVNEMIEGQDISWQCGNTQTQSFSAFSTTMLSHATFCSKVGSILRQNGEHNAALELLRKALSIRVSFLGKNHSDTASSHLAVGHVLEEKGDISQALLESRTALAIQETVFGRHNPTTAGTLIRIGSLLKKKGDLDLARGCYQRVLSMRRGGSTTRLVVAAAHDGLSSLHEAQRNYTSALSGYESSLNMHKLHYGDKHPTVANCHNNIGRILNKKKDLQAAKQQYQQALSIRESVLGNDHPETAASLNNIGSVSHDELDFDMAMNYYQKALSVRLSALGEDHPKTADSLCNIGFLMLDMGHYKSALDRFQRALDIRNVSLGEYHVDTAAAHRNIAKVYECQHDLDGALESYVHALFIQTSALGQNHRDVAKSLEKIGDVLSSKQDKEAATYYEKAAFVFAATSGLHDPSYKAVKGKLESARSLNARYQCSPTWIALCILLLLSWFVVFPAMFIVNHGTTSGATNSTRHWFTNSNSTLVPFAHYHGNYWNKTHYSVSVPPEECVQPGDKFLARVGGSLLWIECPQEIGQGREIAFYLSDPIAHLLRKEGSKMHFSVIVPNDKCTHPGDVISVWTAAPGGHLHKLSCPNSLGPGRNMTFSVSDHIPSAAFYFKNKNHTNYIVTVPLDECSHAGAVFLAGVNKHAYQIHCPDNLGPDRTVSFALTETVEFEDRKCYVTRVPNYACSHGKKFKAEVDGHLFNVNCPSHFVEQEGLIQNVTFCVASHDLAPPDPMMMQPVSNRTNASTISTTP